LGEQEIEENKVGVKFLRERKEQQFIPREELDEFLINNG
jgi:histidyl-tRNA synthetase